jgi:hypothetical protein
MAFNFAKFGEFGAKTATAATSAKVDPKTSFIAACNQNITALLDGEEPSKGAWYKIAADGSVKIILKTGIRVLPVEKDSNQIVVSDTAAAVKYLQAVSHAAKEGELDAYFNRAAELTKLANANKKPSAPKKKVLTDAEIAQRLASK